MFKIWFQYILWVHTELIGVNLFLIKTLLAKQTCEKTNTYKKFANFVSENTRILGCPISIKILLSKIHQDNANLFFWPPAIDIVTWSPVVLAEEAGLLLLLLEPIVCQEHPPELRERRVHRPVGG